MKDLDFDITTLPALNVMYNVKHNQHSYDREYLSQMEIKPRTVKRLGARDHIRTPWIFSQSVFANYKPDNQKILDKCFEVDW